ncbi:MAG: hypothetical protein ABSA85_12840 [Terracidiphilus sp.]|jgi:hypothetical protein
MRKSLLYLALAFIVFGPLPLAAQDVKPVSKPHFTSIEVKHLTTADGVQLSPNFEKYFYASFLAELQRLNIAEQTVEDGAPVVDTDKAGPFSIPHFLVVEGKFVKIQEGSQQGSKFEAGTANLEIRFFRRDNHKEIRFGGSGANGVLFKPKVALNGSLENDEQKVAEAAGVDAADQLRKLVYPGFKLSDLCC